MKAKLITEFLFNIGKYTGYNLAKILFSWVFPSKDARVEFRGRCNCEIYKKRFKDTHANYKKILKKIKEKQKIKVVFISCTNSKWTYDSILQELKNDNRFDVQVLISTYRNYINGTWELSNWQDIMTENYNWFKEKNVSVEYLYSIEKQKFLNLNTFKPDIVFYEQPWQLPKKYEPYNVSKFALTFYSNYGGVNTTKCSFEATRLFREQLFCYLLDNQFAKEQLEAEFEKTNNVFISGNLKLDVYKNPINFDKQIWKTINRKRVIWAPHFSFIGDGALNIGTFDKNYRFLYEYAKKHDDIEFILKPHPELKRHVINNKFMTEKEFDAYIMSWLALNNTQIYDKGSYFDMFKTSDVLITDCSSFLYEYLPSKKPLIHLTKENATPFNEFGEYLTSAYYKVYSTQELEKILERVVLNGDDYLKENRMNVLKSLLPNKNLSAAHIVKKRILELSSKE